MKTTIELDITTEKLKAKLKAISNHAEALADELKEIDNAELCDECGEFLVKVTAYAGDSDIESGYYCPECEG